MKLITRADLIIQRFNTKDCGYTLFRLSEKMGMTSSIMLPVRSRVQSQ